MFTLRLALKLRSWLLLNPRLNRRCTSWLEGPQSSRTKPVAGVLKAPSVLLRLRANETLVKTFMRRQFQRDVEGPAGPPPFMMIIAPPPSIVGPGVAVLKLMVAPMLMLSCRERASSTTSTTLLKF